MRNLMSLTQRVDAARHNLSLALSDLDAFRRGCDHSFKAEDLNDKLGEFRTGLKTYKLTCQHCKKELTANG